MAGGNYKRFPVELFEWDFDDPLAICEYETKKANAALKHYAMMGDGRSQKKLLEFYEEEKLNGRTPPTTAASTIGNWSRVYHWQARVQRWSELQYLKAEEDWADRQAQIRENDFQQGEQLRKIAAAILDEAPNFIKAKKKYVLDPETGRKRVVEIEAIDTNLLLQVLKVASQLQRTAAEMEDNKQQPAATVNVNLPGLNQMSDDENRAYLEKLVKAGENLLDDGEYGKTNSLPN